MTSHKSLPSAVTVVMLMLIMLVGILAERAFLENNVADAMLLLTVTAVILTIRQIPQRKSISTPAN